MKARMGSLLAIPALVLAAAVWLAPGTPTCVPVEPVEPECVTAADCTGASPLLCIGAWACVEEACVWQCGSCGDTEVCGDGVDNDCDGVVDNGCEPPPERCYEDVDCGAVGFCQITNDCCAPPGCLPGMDCPAVCVPCGVCGEPVSECDRNRPCPAGEVCAPDVWCPPCVYGDPPCRVACRTLDVCQPAPVCVPEVCGDGLDNDCDGVVDNGCTPPPQACYRDATCGTAEFCAITNDCCRPEGCGPNDVCIDLCVPCGVCHPRESECRASADCPPGNVCELQEVCPPCVYTPPYCDQACLAFGVCRPAATACADACDCYRAQLPFSDGCPLMCALCGNYWSCENGACAEQCGVFPPEIRDCRTY